MRPRFELDQGGGHDGMNAITMGIAVVFWAAVVVGLVMLINHYATRNASRQLPPEALDPIAVAKLRYAKGEITKTEFEELKKDLK